MRNLKRALSLTLASVMLLGMMVVGSSAASYPDVSDEDNVEAIEVLQKVAVMEGDNNGNFNPDDYVTREQMAVIMSKLLKLDYNYYQGTNPFSDVPAWAAPYVAACAANGITSGIGGGMYGAGQNVSAVQAALMMLKALGYFQYQQDFGDSYILATVKQATEVGLFDGIDSNANQALTRNEVAQMALNALQSEMVTFTGNPGVEYTGSNGESWIGGYKAEYTPRTSTESKYQAIERRTSDVSGGNNLNRGQYYIQLGEELYNGILRLNDRTLDAFGRPSRTWTYDGNEIGTYAKKELLVESYTEGVKGRTLYELLTQATIRDYELDAYLDGYHNGHNNDTNYNVRKDNLVRSNNSNQNGSARGVLTEVYVDNDWEEITIVSINTYLAQANSDYNEASETVSLSVYYSGDKDSTNVVTTLVDKEDVEEVVNLKKDQWVLINWADESDRAQDKIVQKILDPEIMEDVTVTAFTRSKGEDKDTYDKVGERVTEITADGTTYKNNENAWYKRGTLYDYNNDELVNKTYTLYMDQYGNFIGAELYSGQAQYVFITGYDRPKSNLSVSTAKANAIFTDGTMAAIDVNVKDTNTNINNYCTGHSGTDPELKYIPWSTNGTLDGKYQENMWYTYTVRGDVYTLSPAKGFTYSENTRTVAPLEETVNCSNVRLTPNDDNHFGTGRSYGEDASIYITVRTGDVDTRIDGSSNEFDPTKAITEVGGVYTGVQNVNLVYGVGCWIHAVYAPDDNNMIVAAVILGEAEGVVDNYAYIRDKAYNERYDAASDIHYWKVDVILNGELKTMEIKSRFANTVGNLRPGYVQELVLDADGYVTKINDIFNDDGKRLAKIAGGDKVYDEPDYLLTNKSSAHVLEDFDIYDLETGSDVNASSFTSGGTTIYYVEPVYQGRTLYIAAGKDHDIGLDFTTDAKAIVHQKRNGKTEYVAYNDVKTAVDNLADAYVASGVAAANGRQFNGRIVAALNKDGVAEWVLFDDYTSIKSTDPNYGNGGQQQRTYVTDIKINTLPYIDIERTNVHDAATQAAAAAEINTWLAANGYHPMWDGAKVGASNSDAAAAGVHNGAAIVVMKDNVTMTLIPRYTDKQTVYVDDKPVATVGHNTTATVKISGKGTGYVTGTTYAAYPSTGSITTSALTQPVYYVTGYVSVNASGVQTATTTGFTGSNTFTADEGTNWPTSPAAAEAGSTVNVKLTWTANPGATKGAVVVIGGGAVAQEYPLTAEQLKAGETTGIQIPVVLGDKDVANDTTTGITVNVKDGANAPLTPKAPAVISSDVLTQGVVQSWADAVADDQLNSSNDAKQEWAGKVLSNMVKNSSGAVSVTPDLVNALNYSSIDALHGASRNDIAFVFPLARDTSAHFYLLAIYDEDGNFVAAGTTSMTNDAEFRSKGLMYICPDPLGEMAIKDAGTTKLEAGNYTYVIYQIASSTDPETGSPTTWTPAAGDKVVITDTLTIS